MIQKLTRRDMLIGGITTGLAGALSTSAIARNFASPKSAFQGSNDPIVSVPNMVATGSARSMYITVYPPQSYAPGVEFTVKIVRMVFSTNGQGEMTAGYNDEYLDGISGGQFESTVTFPANSGPINLAVSITQLSSGIQKNYAAVAFNASNSAAGMFLLTP